MIKIENKSRCTGCTACMNVCPVQCITMKEDIEGFVYPSVDEISCIGCDACVDVCPFNKCQEQMQPLAYAVRTRFESVSSSGGAVAEIASQWVNDGGCVYGAAFDDSFQVCHIKASSQEELIRLRTSKYVQSRLDRTFAQIKGILSEGQKVLFIGTPCQVAGLKSFIGQSDSLLTVQLACHGVPAPKLWKSYLAAIARNLGGSMMSVNFREKSTNWKHYNVAYKSSAKELKLPFNEDTYMLAYLQNLSIRPSCYECSFRGKACADIVAGDLWNADALLPDLFDGKSFTLLAINTEKGHEILDKLNGQGLLSHCIPVPYADAADSNPGFGGSFNRPDRRAEFFSGLYTSQDISAHMNSYITRVPKIKVWYAAVHSFFSRIKKKLIR